MLAGGKFVLRLFHSEETEGCKAIPVEDFTLSARTDWIPSRTELGKTASTHLTPRCLPGKLQKETRVEN